MNNQLSSEEVRKIIKRFQIEPILNIEKLPTTGNIDYLFSTGSKKYLLRLCPGGHRWRSIEEINAELELLDYLKNNNFPVLCALKDETGNRIVSWDNHNGYIREFSKGKEILKPTSEQIGKFGEALGRFHFLTENFRTKNKRTHIFNLDMIRKHFSENRQIIADSRFPQKELFIREFETNISKLNFPDNLPSGMIHEDLGRRHVLWIENQISAIIDFDRSYYGFLLLDLGQTCRGWCFIDDWKKWNMENFKELIRGYQKIRRLTDLERKYLSDSIIFGILERAQSFYLRFAANHDENDARFALDSVTGQLNEVKKAASDIAIVAA